jgi:hypothetical protein
MFKSSVLSINERELKTNVNIQIVTTLNGFVPPRNIVVNGVDSGTVDNRNIKEAGNTVNNFLIDPWQHGRFSNNKNNMNWTLSPQYAIEQMAMEFKGRPIKNLLAVMVVAQNPSEFAFKLKKMLSVVSSNELEKCFRQAAALSNHNQDKLFIQKATHNHSLISANNMKSMAVIKRIKQSMAIVSAVNADGSLVNKLNEFKAERVNRQQLLNAAIAQIKPSLSVDYVLQLNGGGIHRQLLEMEPLTSNDAFCSILCFYGDDEMLPLMEFFT